MHIRSWVIFLKGAKVRFVVSQKIFRLIFLLTNGNERCVEFARGIGAEILSRHSVRQIGLIEANSLLCSGRDWNVKPDRAKSDLIVELDLKARARPSSFCSYVKRKNHLV